MTELKKMSGYNDLVTFVKSKSKKAQAGADGAVETMDVVVDCDRFVVAGNISEKKTVIVIKTAKPYTHDEIAKTLKVKSEPQKLKGGTVYYKLQRPNTLQGGPGPGGMGGMQGMGGAQGMRGGMKGMGGMQGMRGGMQGMGGAQGMRGMQGMGGAQGMRGGMQGGAGGPPNPGGNPPGFMALPNDRTIVFAILPEAKLEDCFSTDGTKVRLSADLQAQIKKVEANTQWLAWQIEDSLKQQAAGMKFLLGKQFHPLLDAVGHAKSLSQTLTLGDQVKLSLEVGCDSDAGAREFTKVLQAQGDNIKGVVATVLLVSGLPGDISKAVMELVKSLKFETAGMVSKVSCQVSKETLGKAIEAGKKFDWSKLQRGGVRKVREAPGRGGRGF
jgi:hypothetical protein